MPTDIDLKLAEDLADFRVEVAGRFEKVAERFGAVDAAVAAARLEAEKRFGALDSTLAGVDRELRLIRWIGAFVAAAIVGGVVSSWRVIWDASALNSRVEVQGKALGELRSDLRRQGEALEELLRRTAPRVEVPR